MNRKIFHGLNILRIISMLGIVGLHILNIGGALNRSNLLTPANSILAFLYILCICSVNSFAMLTGYLYAGRETVKSQNLLNLLTTVIFYCTVITGVFLIFGRDYLEEIGEKVSLFPFLANRFWYIACYVLLFVLIPYINIMVNHLGHTQLRKLVVILFVLTSCIPVICRLDFFRIQKGYSSAWLIICYVFGIWVNRSKDSGKMKTDILWFILLSIITFVISLYQIYKYDDTKTFGWLTEYISPFIVIMSMLSVRIFSRINITDGILTKCISSVSAAAFDVYILHSHILIYDNLITDSFGFVNTLPVQFVVPCFIFILVGIYLTGFVAYMLRKQCFRVVRIDKILKTLGKKIDKVWFEGIV